MPEQVTAEERARFAIRLQEGCRVECSKCPHHMFDAGCDAIVRGVAAAIRDAEIAAVLATRDEIAKWFETKADLLGDTSMGEVDEITRAIVNQHRSDAKFLRSLPAPPAPAKGERT